MLLRMTMLILCGLTLTACNIGLGVAQTPTREGTAKVQQASETPLSTIAQPPTPLATSSPADKLLTPTNTPSETPAPLVATARVSQAMVMDHRAVDLFNEIPNVAIASAAELRLMYRHASVGENISFGLNCLRGNFPDRRPTACSTLHDLKYNRDNWSFQFRGNPGWIEKVDDFIVQTELQIEKFDVFTFSLGYIDGLDGGTYPIISEPDNFRKLLFDKLEALEAAYPEKTFVLWTMPLARLGYANTQMYNEMVRNYALENNQILFDIADIESHDPLGNKIMNEEGYDVIYQGYTDESRAGHLNTAGRERVAKAFWYLMARVSGWEGVPGGP